MNMYFLQEIYTQRKIVYWQMLVKGQVVIFPHQPHSSFHPFLEPKWWMILSVGELFIIQFNNDIPICKNLSLQEQRKSRMNKLKTEEKKSLEGNLKYVIVTTLALGLRPRQRLARVRAKREARESHLVLLGV